MVKFKNPEKPKKHPHDNPKQPQQGFSGKHNEHLRNETSFIGHKITQTHELHNLKTPRGK